MRDYIIEILMIVFSILMIGLIFNAFDIKFNGKEPVMFGLGLFIGETIYRLSYKKTQYNKNHP
ncbi:hypothetical protein ACMGE9_09925 [Macrococcus sp. EM39E]|uniref:hypothetical protein n=1 Tax=Macrococcus animalis TaxID=3395467 RepID=UPI0039BE256E